MKNKVLILSSIVSLVVGFFLGQILGTPRAFASDNDHDGLVDLVDVDDNDGQNDDQDNDSVKDQDERG